MTEYRPQPIETSNVTLPESVIELIDILARNTHDIWARQRIAEGWRYGRHRDDSTKHHPGLVPYEELTDSEKQYDRNTAIETLKTMSVLGYTIRLG
jgi:RyR domain-containing protein